MEFIYLSPGEPKLSVPSLCDFPLILIAILINACGQSVSSLYFVPQSAFYHWPVTAVCSLHLNGEQFSIPAG